mgnify:CR=1 FL=1
MNVRAPLAIAGAVLLLAGVAWRLWPARPHEGDGFAPGPRAVVVVPAVRREIDDRIEALGTTASWESVEIRPTVTENIDTIRFTDGQSVAAGDVLVTLEQDEERAKLAEATSLLAEQERELRRIESLVARKSLPASQLDERRTLRDVAREIGRAHV